MFAPWRDPLPPLQTTKLRHPKGCRLFGCIPMSQGPDDPRTDATDPAKIPSRILPAAILFIAVLALATAIYVWVARRAHAASEGSVPSVAQLDFSAGQLGRDVFERGLEGRERIHLAVLRIGLRHIA